MYQPKTTCATVYGIRTSFLVEENFDEKLFLTQDAELNLRLRTKYFPESHIFIDKNFKFKKRRHEDGGTMSFKTLEKTEFIVNYVNKKYNFSLYRIKKSSYDKNISIISVNFVKYLKFLKEKNGNGNI